MLHMSTEGFILLQIVVASILPTIVAYVTDSRAPKAVKTWALIVLTVVASLVTSLLAGPPDVDLKQLALSFFGMLFAAVAAHKGVTSNLNLSGAGSLPADHGLKLGGPSTTGHSRPGDDVLDC